MILIKILLFGTFEGERAGIERFFEKAALSEYDTPLSLFVTTRFKSMAADADVALMGGEPRYKSYIVAAKKAGCKTALWGCELGWLSSCHAALLQFDLIFARDKAVFTALREAGFPEVVLCPQKAAEASPEPVKPVVAEPEPEPAVEIPVAEPEAAEPIIEEPFAEPEAPVAEEPETLPDEADEEFELIIDIPPDEKPEERPAAPFSPPKNPFGIAPVTSVYGVVNLNENIRSASSAGGVFSLLCEDMIRRGGVVFGASYNGKFEAVHAVADRIPDCVPMRGAKYAGSVTGSVYEQAAVYLQKGAPVLFTGTACQIAELNAYLCWIGTPPLSESPLLLTVDIACSGVAEPAVFAAYLAYVEKRLGAPVTAVDMSGKPRGWHKATARIGSESGTYEVPVYRDPFMRAYRAGLCLTDKCYECPHRTAERRGSDLTLGSFSEGRKYIPDLYDDKGASVALAHTEKGRAVIESLEPHRAIFCEIPPDALPHYNDTLTRPPARAKKRDAFMSDYMLMPFDKAVSRSLGPVWMCILSHRRKILPAWKPRKGRR